MGLADWLKLRSSVQHQAPDSSRPSAAPQVTIEMTISGPSADGLVKLSGTTTFGRGAVSALLARHGSTERGMLILAGVLQREPENPADGNAVAVLVEGEKIGYLPSYIAAALPLSNAGAIAVPVQLFYIRLPGKPARAEGWTWLGGGTPEWVFSELSPPPLTSAEKNKASHVATNEMVEDAMRGGGERARHFADGISEGIHYLQTIEPIKQLKREGKMEEALRLCYIAIGGAEAAREGRAPAPWYTEQAAIILRKLDRRDEEVLVLVRWLAACPVEHRDGSKIALRLVGIR